MATFESTPAKYTLVTHDQENGVTNERQSKNNHQYDNKKLKATDFNQTGESKYQSPAIMYTLVHEIRNPLTNIRLSLALMEAEAINDDLKRYLDIISRNTDRINNLLSNLLNSFNEKKELARYFSINYLLDESLEMAKDRIVLKKARIEKFYDYGCCELMLEESLIKIAFLNIIINAIEAMPGENGVLKLTTTSNDTKCTVTIEDNGTGINPAHMEKLFVPFFTTKPMGIGLGLSATLHILQSQQATVKVESEEGKGTKFIISF